MSVTERKRSRPKLAVGDAGEIQVLPINEIHIDHSYQRDLVMSLVEKIAAEWNIVTAGTIVVSRRPDGTLYCVDGQHRLAGATLAGETEILAQVVDGLTAAEEAWLRLRGNVKRSDRITEVFRAKVFAGDERATGLQNLLREHETQINYTPELAQGINAIAACEKIYAIDRGATLNRTLWLLRDAFGPINGTNCSSDLLKAVTWFLSRHDGESDRERLVIKMREQGPAGIRRMAYNQKSAMGGTMWLNTYRALVEIYNHGLRERSMLEWRTSRATVTFDTGRHTSWPGGEGDR